MCPGNPVLSCGDTCAETVSVLNDEEVVLNTSLSFADGGICNVVQFLHLSYNSDLLWYFNFKNQESDTIQSTSLNIELTTLNSGTAEYSFVLNVTNITVNNSGLYTVSLVSHNLRLDKNFTVKGN